MTSVPIPLRPARLAAGLLAAALVACSPPAPEGEQAATPALEEPGSALPPATSPEPQPCVVEALAAEPVRGLDVSHHNGEVDWLTVCRRGYGFVYLKASEGVDAPDQSFADHRRAAGELGLLRGAYHFYVTEDDPDAQADLFLSTLGGKAGELLPAVDVELIGHGTEAGWPDDLRRFLDRVEAELGVRPMIYTAPNFWNAHLGSGFGEHPLWVAEYGVGEPRLPEGWESWHLWQYAEDQRVAGVEKTVDVNRVHPEKGLAALRNDG